MVPVRVTNGLHASFSASALDELDKTVNAKESEPVPRSRTFRRSISADEQAIKTLPAFDNPRADQEELYQWPSIHNSSSPSQSRVQSSNVLTRSSAHTMSTGPTELHQDVSLRSASRTSLSGLIPITPITPPPTKKGLDTSIEHTLRTAQSFAFDRQAYNNDTVVQVVERRASLVVAGLPFSSVATCMSSNLPFSHV